MGILLDARPGIHRVTSKVYLLGIVIFGSFHDGWCT